MFELSFFIIISLILLFSAISDYKTYKVKNVYIFLILFITFLYYSFNAYYLAEREYIYKFIIFMVLGYILMLLTYKYKLWGGADSKLLWALMPAITYFAEGYTLSFILIIAYFIIFWVMTFIIGILTLISKSKPKIPLFIVFAFSYIILFGYKLI